MQLEAKVSPIINVLLYALLVFCVSRPICASSQSAQVSSTSSDIKLLITLDKTKFSLTDQVMVTAFIINTSNQTVSYDDRGFELKEFAISVIDSSQKPIQLTRYGAMVKNYELPTAIYRDVIQEILPGYEAEYHFWLNRQFDMTLPGTYYVIIGRSVVTDKGQSLSLVSSPTPIVVTDGTNAINSVQDNLQVPTIEKIPTAP